MLSLRGESWPELRETACFARDLLELIAEGVALLPANAEAAAMLEDLRGQVSALELGLRRSLQ